MSWFKLLVTGGRKYADWVRLAKELDPFFQAHGHEMILIEGGAQGADRLARQWAKKKGILVATVEAQWDWWKEVGALERAGTFRNLGMAQLQPDLVVAFPGGSGTANMVKTAREYGIEVYEVK